jgi:hypothetical protein
MLTKKLAALAAIGTFALCAIGASSASAASYLHGANAATGKLLVNGTTLAGTLKAGTTATYVTGLGTITCSAGSIGATVGASGGASVSSTLTGFTLSSCTGWPGFPVDTCKQVGTAATPSITASGAAGGSVTTSNLLTFCHYTGSGTPGFGCYFKATSAVGNYVNNAAGGNLTYTNVAFAPQGYTAPFPAGGGSHLGVGCSGGGTFNAQFSGISATSGAFTGSAVLNTTA